MESSTVSVIDEYKNAAIQFTTNLPYLQEPYKKRQWGHPWHSLCSYHGKLKPAIASLLISCFSQPGEVVLDPMCGVGTIPFEACLQGRYGIGNDLNELAFSVTKAKLEAPDKNKVEKVLNSLENFINNNKEEYNNVDLPYKSFGLNKRLPDYFHSETYKEILVGRNFFVNRIQKLSAEEALVLSAFAHVLHGNRPYALSRRSHPLTPYSPSGEFVYKNVIEHIKNKVKLVYSKGEWKDFIQGKSLHGDLFDLPKYYNEDIDLIVTSPPFSNSLKFSSNNWMRLWLTGWEPEDFKEDKNSFIEKKQKESFDVYYDFFKMCFHILKQDGKMILHLGKSNKTDMGEELAKVCKEFFEIIHIGSEDVSLIEKHGIKDKGGTTAHQFMFLTKKKD